MSRARTFRVRVRKFGPFESAIRKQWLVFEEREHTGLSLDVEALDLEPLSAALFEQEQLLRGGCDVAFVNTDWVARLHETRAVVDLAPFLRDDPPEGYPQAWTPSMLRLQEVSGEVVGVPYHDGPECLVYRTDLFEDTAALRVPETWEEFHQVARHLHRPEHGLYGTGFAALPDRHNTVYDFLLHVWTRGGEIFAPGGGLRLDSPEVRDALEFYRGMLNDSSAVHPRCRDLDSVALGAAFAAGEIAMMVNWFGFAALAEAAEHSRARGRTGVAPVPHAPGCAPVSLNIYWLLAIAAGSPHARVAWRFLRHTMSAAMDKLLTLEGAIGCRASTWRDGDVNRTVPFFQRLEALHTHARELPRRADWPQVARLLEDTLIAAAGPERALARVLRDAQRRADRLFSAPL